MPSTSDLFAQALQDYARPGGKSKSLTDLENFDPTAALQQYGQAAYGDFSQQLGQQLSDLKGSAVGAGRLKTGFFDTDTGRLTQTLAGQYQRDLSSQALAASGQKLGATEAAAGIGEEEQNRYLDLLSGQLDRDTAAQNARRQQQGGLLSGLGSLAGTLGGAAILASSERFKDDVEPIDHASDRLSRMPGVRFRYKGSDEPNVGVLAEDVDRELPEASVRDGEGRPTAVDYPKLMPLLVEASREQGEEIQRLRGELDRLTGGGRLGERRAA